MSVENSPPHDQDQWLDAARRLASPNFNDRPQGVEPSLLVIHNISLPPDNFGGTDVEALFLNKLDWAAHPYYREIEGLQVSAHFYIKRSGQLLQFVPLNRRAWHAGQSVFEGVANCNDYSIGVELEGSDHVPFTDVQYDQLGQLTQAIRALYPNITRARITGHSAISPGRKTDPGPHFDWPRYLSLIGE
ncbi:1,6-anhydro-N-acetylmuramyl-L-alanine amidase AmpD [Simiduia curdlanivorans]|uniref:1,6-anhydro-N-acetylmuramyl-L-alanine amidase AmpD n=1 Tax=Simiduia curdlanivorans TaxID=1492769 RepID=A0ABV8V819_9GAMM|nr:1,6-anhydro-N-acetylmuramyl-L-alanine amidase AmpD [Simiduia curdlanivorans]MDN3638995.1 1,6-anhydro-N-acetylmuramyl-L-alanine amidase AmpD [Simiduia curdlanivorans]